MSGELIVQTLKGPTSGANANKVIVPSGQTLDASGGTLVPSAGQVVQTVTGQATGYTSHSTTSWTATTLAVTITPKHNNSIIRLDVSTNVWFITGSANADYAALGFYRNGTSILATQYGTVLKGAKGAYENYNDPINFTHYDNPSTTSSLTYTLYARSHVGNWSFGVNDTGSGYPIVTATEIKQ